MLERIIQDEAYAAYFSGDPIQCEGYMSCKAIKIPKIIDLKNGYGWLFPKHSPLFPLLDLHIKEIVEYGYFQRTKNSYLDMEDTKPHCPNYAGDPIGTEKTFSLFIMMFAGVATSITTLRYL